MTMEGHGGGGDGNGDGDGKRIGCDELDLELSLASRGLRKRPPEDPLPPVVSQELRELLPPPPPPPQSEQLFRMQQPLRSSRLRAGPAATAQPCRCPAAPPTLPASIEPVLPNRQPPDSSTVMPRACNRNTTRHVQYIVEQTEFFQSSQGVTPALPPAPPPIAAVRPVFARFFESVHPNGQPTHHPPVLPPAPPPIEAGRAPFPWTGDCPATVRPINWLRANGITHIHGEVRCGSCGVQKVVSYELESKAGDTRDFMFRRRHYLDDHTKSVWSKVSLLPCDSCGGSGCVGPVIPARDEDINWLFLLLGQTLGALSLAQLKNFCGQTHIHRTGAKNRLLVNIYVKLCRQLIPDWKINADPKNDQ